MPKKVEQGGASGGGGGGGGGAGGGAAAADLTPLERAMHQRDAQKAAVKQLSARLVGPRKQLAELTGELSRAQAVFKRAKLSVLKYSRILQKEPENANAKRFLEGAEQRILSSQATIGSVAPKIKAASDSISDDLAREKIEKDKLKQAEEHVCVQASMLTLVGIDKSDYPTYAENLAQAIVAEIPEAEDVFPKKRELMVDWLDEVDSRESLRFSCERRVKSSLGVMGVPDIVSDVAFDMRDSTEDSSAELKEKLLHWFFCMTHAGFTPRSGMDMEHADPYEHIRKKQQRLLTFLNNTPEFAKTLMKIPPMNEFMRIKPGTSRVQFSRYFILRGYNAIDNMWLLCHVCNLSKGASGPVEWVGEKPLFKHPFRGDPFKKCVSDAGGLQEGVLVDRIFSPDPGAPFLQRGNGERVSLYQGKGAELGAFIRSWFSRSNEAIFRKCRMFQAGVVESFRASLCKMISDSGDMKQQASRYLDTRLLILSYLESAMPVSGTQSDAFRPGVVDIGKSASGSSSDDDFSAGGGGGGGGGGRARLKSEDGSTGSDGSGGGARSDSGDDGSFAAVYREGVAESLLALMQEVEPTFHEIKKIIGLLDATFGKEERREIWCNMDQYLRTMDWGEFLHEDWRHLYVELLEIASSGDGLAMIKNEVERVLSDFWVKKLDASDEFEEVGAATLFREEEAAPTAAAGGSVARSRLSVFSRRDQRLSGVEMGEGDTLTRFVDGVTEVSHALRNKSDNLATGVPVSDFLKESADTLDDLLRSVYRAPRSKKPKASSGGGGGPGVAAE